ncbi:activin receptor type-1 [Microplitis demolitor]|uniref:activin receptor type-1 n=1 Tax=Microplitis demolitor TaxID=69319 RepID=UPI0004CD5721|nr:activin receptor type-1 [Microplitis demolitor]
MANTIIITQFMVFLTFKLSQGDIQRTLLLDDKQNGLSSEEPTEYPNEKYIHNGAQKKLTCYSCEGEECSQPELCHDAATCWKSTVRQVDGTERVKRACTSEPDQVLLTCNKKAPSSKSEAVYHVECCYSDLCNKGPFPVLEPLSDTGGKYYATKLALAIVGSILLISSIVGGILFYTLAGKTRRKRSLVLKRNKLLVDPELEPSMLHFPSSSLTSTTNYHPHELRATAAGDSTLKEYLDGRSLTSGSGSGLPLLVQRTLAKQVALVECLGNGGSSGFGGEVWRGVWHGECVAVKIYFSRDEAAWARETEVYSQLLPSRHDNILGYVGSDMTSRASCTQLWLVTHYHPLGSLYDHLNRSPHPLTHHQTLNICLGIVNGLLYLHTEIHGTKGKPSIAHRNLKSKNILVKTNGSCVIADFALTTTQERLSTDRIDLRQGTKRYMSPEILAQTLNVECLESFRRADIYSLGLIMWEVCRRCISNGVALDYAAPYSEWLSSNTQEPSIEEIRKLVSVDQRRPPLPNRWHSDPTLSGMGKLMRECWHGKPAARLPILRVKKTLIKLAANDCRVHLTID